MYVKVIFNENSRKIIVKKYLISGEDIRKYNIS